MSRIGAMRNKIAGVAAKSRIKPRARLALRQERHLPVGDTALWCQSQRNCEHREQCLKQNSGRDLLAARRAGFRRGKSRCGVNRNVIAGDAAMSRTGLGARFARRRSVGGFGGSRRFFGTSRGNPVVLAPGIGRKIAAHTAGKAASPIRGISKGSTPWITFASFS